MDRLLLIATINVTKEESFDNSDWYAGVVEHSCSGGIYNGCEALLDHHTTVLLDSESKVPQAVEN